MSAPHPGAASPSIACVDSHAHLAMRSLACDIPGILERAVAAGITDVLTAATSLEDAPATIEIASSDAPLRIWAAVGFHPHEAKRWQEGEEERLAPWLRRERVVALGEIGLDYHYDLSPREAQRAVLRRQVCLARRLGLPIIVHSRKSASDVAVILEEEGARDHGGVIHCFTEDAAFARRCLDLGFYVSFSGIVTFRTAGDLRGVVKIVPEDRLLVETDSPYLAPMPHRGERNEPARAAVVLQAVAAIRGENPSRLGETIRRNFHRFIRRSEERPRS